MDLTVIITEYLVPIVALVTLTLSIYNTYRHWKEYRPNISLSFSYEDTIFDPSVGDIPFNCYVIRAKNLGNVNIIIDFAGFKWENKEYERQYYGSTLTEAYLDFPYKLTPGSTIEIEFPINEIRSEISKSGLSGLTKITGFIKDGNGKYYLSPPIEIDRK